MRISREGSATAPAAIASWGLDRAARAWRLMRLHPIGFIGLFMVTVIVFLAIGADVFSFVDPNEGDFRVRLEGPSLDHWFGTDNLGRDQWSRIVHGARLSVIVGFASVGFGTLVGLAVGVSAGYMGGRLDSLSQRIVEIMLSLPDLLMALVLVATLGSGPDKVVLALAIIFIPSTVRVVRGTVLSAKENMYVDAARALGASQFRIMFRHILPNVTATYLVLASSFLGVAVLIEATLSFLGLGVPPPQASWGRMLSGSVRDFAVTAPWMVIFPGLAISWLVIGFNLFGDALRDIWDPRLGRGRREV